MRLSVEQPARVEGGGEGSSSGGGPSGDPPKDTGTSEGNSGGKAQEDGKRKRYHRHSLHQIEELER
jgi:hypothetical protein